MSTPVTIALLGGPASGKTTYLGALADALSANVSTSLRIARAAADARGFLRLMEPLQQGEYPRRTNEERHRFHAELDAISPDGAATRLTLEAGDYDGEEVERLFRRERPLTDEWRARADARGVLLFVRHDATTPLPKDARPPPTDAERWKAVQGAPAESNMPRSTTPDDPMARLGYGLTTIDLAAPPARPHDRVKVPTTLALIEVLQFLRHLRGLDPGERPRRGSQRVAILLAAWDAVAENKESSRSQTPSKREPPIDLGRAASDGHAAPEGRSSSSRGVRSCAAAPRWPGRRRRLGGEMMDARRRQELREAPGPRRPAYGTPDVSGARLRLRRHRCALSPAATSRASFGCGSSTSRSPRPPPRTLDRTFRGSTRARCARSPWSHGGHRALSVDQRRNARDPPVGRYPSGDGTRDRRGRALSSGGATFLAEDTTKEAKPGEPLDLRSAGARAWGDEEPPASRTSTSSPSTPPSAGSARVWSRALGAGSQSVQASTDGRDCSRRAIARSCGQATDLEIRCWRDGGSASATGRGARSSPRPRGQGPRCPSPPGTGMRSCGPSRLDGDPANLVEEGNEELGAQAETSKCSARARASWRTAVASGGASEARSRSPLLLRPRGHESGIAHAARVRARDDGDVRSREAGHAASPLALGGLRASSVRAEGPGARSGGRRRARRTWRGLDHAMTSPTKAAWLSLSPAFTEPLGWDERGHGSCGSARSRRTGARVDRARTPRPRSRQAKIRALPHGSWPGSARRLVGTVAGSASGAVTIREGAPVASAKEARLPEDDGSPRRPSSWSAFAAPASTRTRSRAGSPSRSTPTGTIPPCTAGCTDGRKY